MGLGPFQTLKSFTIGSSNDAEITTSELVNRTKKIGWQAYVWLQGRKHSAAGEFRVTFVKLSKQPRLVERASDELDSRTEALGNGGK